MEDDRIGIFYVLLKEFPLLSINIETYMSAQKRAFFSRKTCVMKFSFSVHIWLMHGGGWRRKIGIHYDGNDLPYTIYIRGHIGILLLYIECYATPYVNQYLLYQNIQFCNKKIRLV